MATKVIPFGNQILVKPIKEESILLTNDEMLLNYGDVVDIGDEVSKVKVGDKICFTIWGLNHVEIEDEKHYFVPEDKQFILGFLKD